MMGVILGLYLMPILITCTFSHFAIEPVLDIFDHDYDIETNWSFGGIVYFRCVLDSARSTISDLGPFLPFLRVLRSPGFTKLHFMVGINR